MTNPEVTRAAMLMQVRRFDEAVVELRRALGAEPNDARLHALLAQALVETKQLAEATEAAETAVRLAPDIAYPYFVLARVWLERNFADRAMTAVDEAIRIDPYDPDYHALRSALQFNASRWREALASAEAGLAIEAEHVQCNNLRAMALVKLGRGAEAGATIDAALAREPDNSWTHANKGWALLEARRTDEALKHFRESLRLDPTNEYARAGLVEGLKGRHFIYGLFLRYLLWMAKLPPSTQWGLIIGGFIGYQVIRNVAAGNPELAPYLRPLIYAYLAFVWFTWLAQPVFNLLLRLHPLGRHALSSDQRRETNWIGLVMLTAVVCFGLSYLGDLWRPLGLIAVLVALLAMPIKIVFSCDPGWPRQVMTAGVAVLAAIIAGIALAIWSLDNVDLFEQLTNFYWIGFAASVWGGQALAAVTPRK
jgi:tetratricopeptide (TPR) repeat protein